MCALIHNAKQIDNVTRNEIIQIQNAVYELNSIVHAENDRYDFEGYRENISELNNKISRFNGIQYYGAIQNGRIKDAGQLLPIFEQLLEQPCINAICKIRGAHDVFVTYRIREIGFHELLKKQIQLQSIYARLKGSVSKLAYCVFENSKMPIDGRYCFGISSIGRNPYEHNPLNEITDDEIRLESTKTILGVKKILSAILKAICGDDIKPISSKITRTFIAEVCIGQKVNVLIDDLFLAYHYNKSGIDWAIANGKMGNSGISRHVSWCSYRTKENDCIFLGQRCHSSVDCAFYRCSKQNVGK